MAPRRLNRITICLGLVLTAALFGRAIALRETFIFRDAGHYYGPLFQWNAAEWRAGRMPAWNPLEGLGSPTLGDATSSVFYPAQALFLGPLEFYRAYNLYIVVHLAIAAWGAGRLAVCWGCRPPGAGWAALAYAFSGPVMFQYCNVVFLVGAAWLPWALAAIHGVLTARERRDAVRSTIALAVCLALMVLGGDPQMACHVAIAAALYGAVIARCSRLGSVETQPQHMQDVQHDQSLRLGRFHPRWLLLGGGFLLAACLAAAQIGPAFEFARLSPRAADDGPRNVWELIAWTLSPPPASIDGQPVERPERSLLVDAEAGSSHMRHVYQFSVGPWRWLELAWPNILGQQFPEHCRWSAAIGEKRIWAPSLYAGALMLPFLFGGWREAGSDPRWRWMRCLGVGAALASLGEYGLGWVLNAVAESFAGRTLAVGSEVGGVAWWLNVLLPGYVSFRYPAKLWTIAALAMAMISARGIDGALAADEHAGPAEQGALPPGARRVLRAILALGGAGVVGLAAACAGRNWFLEHLASAPPDSIFGPLDARGAWNDIALGFVQSGAVLLAGGLLLRYRPRGANFSAAALLALLVIDLAVAHRWLAPTAEFEAFSSAPALMPQSIQDHASSSPARFLRADNLLPAAWRERGSPDRLREMLAWDRDTIAPKYNLPLGLGCIESSGMAPEAEVAFWQVARLHDPRFATAEIQNGGREKNNDGRAKGIAIDRELCESDLLPHPSALALANVKYLILPSGLALDGFAARPTSTLKSIAGADVHTIRPPRERAWVVHRVTRLAELSDRRPAAIRRRTETVLFPGGQPRDWRVEAVVETADETMAMTPTEDATPRGSEAKITFDDPQRVVVEANSSGEGLLVLAEAFESNWRATLTHDGTPRDVEILRTNRLLRGVRLPPGRSVVEFVYKPRSFRWGAAISGLAWLAAGVVLMRLRAARLRPTGR